jgi:hypothetical protein
LEEKSGGASLCCAAAVAAAHSIAATAPHRTALSLKPNSDMVLLLLVDCSS